MSPSMEAPIKGHDVYAYEFLITGLLLPSLFSWAVATKSHIKPSALLALREMACTVFGKADESPSSSESK